MRPEEFDAFALRKFSFVSKVKSMHCPLCTTLLEQKMDEDYYLCRQCRGIVKRAEARPDSAAEKAFYLTHENDVHDTRYQAFTAPISNYVLEHFSSQHEGLDFGSGTGPVISKVLTDQGYQIQQYDPYFANQPQLLEQSYDYIVACEVMEHFYSPLEEFARLRRLLRPGGQLIGMTLLYQSEIDFSSWRYRKDPTHVFIYQEETMRYIQALFDFDTVEVRAGRLVVWGLEKCELS